MHVHLGSFHRSRTRNATGGMTTTLSLTTDTEYKDDIGILSKGHDSRKIVVRAL
jgi:hypothetical protein